MKTVKRLWGLADCGDCGHVDHDARSHGPYLRRCACECHDRRRRVLARIPGVKHGHDFNVVLVERGGVWGLNDCQVHIEDDPMVEFYDVAGIADDRPFGQFVSRYNLSTLLCDPGSYGSPKRGGGLCLDGGNADVWAVDGVHLYAVLGAACAATGRLAESGKW